MTSDIFRFRPILFFPILTDLTRNSPSSDIPRYLKYSWLNYYLMSVKNINPHAVCRLDCRYVLACNVHACPSAFSAWRWGLLWRHMWRHLRKGAVCGTNIIGPGQTPRIIRGVWPGPMIFVAPGHLKKTFLSLRVQCLSKLISQNYENSWSRLTLFFPE